MTIYPAPEALTRPRAPTEGIRHKDRIIKTLLQMKNSGKHANLMTPSTHCQKLDRKYGELFIGLANTSALKTELKLHNSNRCICQKYCAMPIQKGSLDASGMIGFLS